MQKKLKKEQERNRVDYNFEDFIDHNKVTTTLMLLSVIFLGIGSLFFRNGIFSDETVEITEVSDDTEGFVIVEIAGAVEKPGVYKLENGSRIEDLLIASGGISANADRDWVRKIINRSSKVSDGQKIYIKKQDEHSHVLSAKENGVYQTTSSQNNEYFGDLININTASAKELESLWGIGPIYAQTIIEHRPYSNVEELLKNGVIKKNAYERNKVLLTVN
jgi:competence protein ComEA